jgi:hypothetical protein
MKSIFRCAFTAWLVLTSMPILGEESARKLLDKARDAVASAPAFRRLDTGEQSAVLIVGGRRMPQPPQTNVLAIEIDMLKLLARQTTTVQGKQLVMLKQGEKAAMKLGSGLWETPSGPYEQMAKDMGNLFVCEKETPETKENAPVWKLVSTESFDGQKAYVIESEGNTAAAIAQARMSNGLVKTWPGDPAQRPTVKVLEYSSKHWLEKPNCRRLQAVQISKMLLTMPLPDGTRQVIEQSSRSISQYNYGAVTIEIPEEAQKILSSGNLPSPKPALGEGKAEGKAKP